MKRWGADVLRGTALAGSLGAGAFVLARFGFGRLYYLNALLPILLASLLLIAWGIHLRADGFFGVEAAEAEHGPEAGAGLVPFEAPVLPRSQPSPRALTARDLVRTLLWAAAELALVSIALYHLAGVGARF